MKPNESKPLPGGQPPAWVSKFILGVFALGGVLLLWALLQTVGAEADAAGMASAGWGDYAVILVGNKTTALWHAALMTLGAGALLWLLTKVSGKTARAWAWILVAVMAGDALWLSRHYVKTMPLSALEENDVIRLLKADMPQYRTALVSQEGFYNFWLTYVFPYHHILSMNVTQMPRMPVDYKRFLEAMGPHPLRYWQLSAVRLVLAPAQFWGQIQNEAGLRDAFELVMAYNVGQAEMGVSVYPATPERPGQHVVMRLKEPGPRGALIGSWRTAGDEEALRALVEAEAPFREVLIAPEAGEGVPSAGDGAAGVLGKAQLVGYRAGKMLFKASTDRPAVLRVSEKYDPDWRAWIDGEPAPVRRVDFLFQGVFVGEPGLHEVLLQYAPDRRGLIGQWAGVLLCAGAGVALVLRLKARRA